MLDETQIDSTDYVAAYKGEQWLHFYITVVGWNYLTITGYGKWSYPYGGNVRKCCEWGL